MSLGEQVANAERECVDWAQNVDEATWTQSKYDVVYRYLHSEGITHATAEGWGILQAANLPNGQWPDRLARLGEFARWPFWTVRELPLLLFLAQSRNSHRSDLLDAAARVMAAVDNWSVWFPKGVDQPPVVHAAVDRALRMMPPRVSPFLGVATRYFDGMGLGGLLFTLALVGPAQDVPAARWSSVMFMARQREELVLRIDVQDQTQPHAFLRGPNVPAELAAEQCLLRRLEPARDKVPPAGQAVVVWADGRLWRALTPHWYLEAAPFAMVRRRGRTDVAGAESWAFTAAADA